MSPVRVIAFLPDRPTMCVVGHTAYGLAMTDGLWHASCSCGWRSAPSPDLADQTDELDQHLRLVVISEQQPTRTARVATGAVLHAVDHTVVLGGLLVGLVLAGPALARRA